MKKKYNEREYHELWQEYAENIRKSTPIDLSESFSDKRARIKKLESNEEKWFAYYFPSFYTSEPEIFHKQATLRVTRNAEYYEVRSWSRELAKTARTMMEVLYLALTRKKRNILLVSNSLDNAERLLLPYKVILELNDRIKSDYGIQKKVGNWEASEFTTRSGVSFRALGAGQSPRGTRNESVRPDVILIDDMDTDEECRNSEVIKQKVNWVEQALIPTRSVSEPLLIIVCGNIIAKYCCITELGKKADTWDIVNIRNAKGESSWRKNSEEDIQRIEHMISYESFQKEYMNNPMDGGDTFKDIIYGEIPLLKQCDGVVVYADPATSNKDKTTSSSKAVVLVASHNGCFYIHSCFVNQMSNALFVDYLFESFNLLCTEKVAIPYVYIENNALQDPFYQQVLLPLIFETGNKKKMPLPIRPDERKKPDKYFRIEGTLEPLNRLGKLIFNKKEKDNPHMKRLVAQFENFNPKSKLMDGPDAVEGAVHILQNQQIVKANKAIDIIQRKPSKYRL